MAFSLVGCACYRRISRLGVHDGLQIHGERRHVFGIGGLLDC